MQRHLIALFTLLSLAPTGAPAKVYNIKLDGYCDRLQLIIRHGRVFGASLAKPKGAPCDNSLLTGTEVITYAPVTPAGRVFTAAGDLGQNPLQFVNYIDLTSHTFTLYGTADGVKMLTISGTWSPITRASDADLDDSVAEPPVTASFFTKARKIPRSP